MSENKNLVLIVIPSAKSKLLKLKIPYKYLKFGLPVGLLLVFLFAFIIFKFISLSMQVSSIDDLARENSELERINSKLQMEVENIEERLESLNATKQKLYAMLDITPAEAGVGDFPETENYDSRYPQTLIEKEKYNVSQLEKHFSKIEPEVKKQEARLASIPSIWPVKGYITSYMGYRSDPFTKKRTYHPGVDIDNKLGTPIIAPADGIVTRVETVTKKNRRQGMGNVIVLEHRFGYKTKFGHLDKVNVKKFQKVKRGQLIGYLGSTGRSTGTHLHYEIIYNKINVNPLNYMLDN